MQHQVARYFAVGVVKAFTSIVLIIGLSGSGCQSVAEALSAAEREQYRLSVMTLNVGGTEDSIWGINVAWRVRYNRLIQWMKDAQTVPDLILLQEMYVRKFWWPATLNPHDYEGLHYLIQEVNAATGGNYRIGYMATTGQQLFANKVTGGLALIYNSTRLRNITKAPASNLQPAEDNPSILGFHPRKSWPCTDPLPEFRDRCGLLDGEGVFYTYAYTALSGGRTFETAGASFVFATDPAARFDVFNVHLSPDPTNYLQSSTYFATRELIARLAANQTSTPVFAPILAGDFNGGTEAFPKFQISRDFDVDAVTTGTNAARYRYQVVSSNVLPNVEPKEPGFCAPRDQIWSDHCAIFVQYEPTRS